MFWYKWIENNNGIKVDELGFILVDLNKEGHKENIFILTSQAIQVFYITDPSDKKWSIVLSTKPKIITDCDCENNTRDNIDEIFSFSLGLIRGDNTDGDNGNESVKDNEFYIEKIFVTLGSQHTYVNTGIRYSI